MYPFVIPIEVIIMFSSLRLDLYSLADIMLQIYIFACIFSLYQKVHDEKIQGQVISLQQGVQSGRYQSTDYRRYPSVSPAYHNPPTAPSFEMSQFQTETTMAMPISTHQDYPPPNYYQCIQNY